MKRVLLSLIIPALIILCLTAGIGYNLLLLTKAPAEIVSITVNSGRSLSSVAQELERTGVIRSSLALKIIARWNKQGGQIQAGSYRFDQPATPGEILKRLIQGDVEKVTLTIPEGFTLQQIIERINQQGYGSKTKLAELAYNSDFITSLNISADSLEGYLYPETYLFAPGNDERALLKMMVNQFQKQITAELKTSAQHVGLSLHQLVTLASIIEKETGVVDEMPLISSVFHNRLKRRIPLQTDPTVIYGIKDFDGNITRKHLKTPTPYNTYMIRGLPPGPIASPGLAALKAATSPAKTNLLYFVARGDGSHKFSKSLKEHNAAVLKYQLRRRHRSN
jgi:peptidoglycan lytic transglycosylase G